MRRFFGMLLAGGLMLGPASRARAQNDLNAFGTYPTGVTTGSPAPYGLNVSGFYGRGYGYPSTSSTQPFAYYGSNYLAPNAMRYDRGYGGYLNSSTGYYSRGYSAFSAPGSYDVYSYPTYGASYTSPGYYRNSGMFSRYRWRGW
jgi:hypothetical protein